jgi:hypothetical protein
VIAAFDVDGDGEVCVRTYTRHRCVCVRSDRFECDSEGYAIDRTESNLESNPIRTRHPNPRGARRGGA